MMAPRHTHPLIPPRCVGLRHGQLLVSLVLLILLAAMPSPAPNLGQPALLRAQPELLAVASAHPDASVQVIVQKTTGTAAVEPLLARLGGTATRDLRIINAVAATLPAHALNQLAAADGVKWISLDSPMIKTGNSDGVVTSPT